MKKRSSNFELLRIISALLILIFHCCGKVDDGFASNYSPKLVLDFILGLWGLAGVSCFMCVSCYFLVDENCREIRWKSISKVITKTIIYALMGDFLAKCFNVEVDSIVDIIKSIFSPISGDYYWFVTMYIMILLLMPFLNHFIFNITYQNHIAIILLLSIILFYEGGVKWLGENIICDTFLGIYYYLIISFYKKYKSLKIKRVFMLLGGLSAVITLGLAIINSYYEYSYNVQIINIGHIFYRYTINQVWVGVALFMIFSEIKIGYSRIINMLAKGSFAVYLISEHPFARRRLWNDYFLLSRSNDGYSIKMLKAVITVYIVATIIELSIDTTLKIIRRIVHD